MLMEDITQAQSVGWDRNLFGAIVAQEVEQASGDEATDGTPMSEVMLSPTTQSVWPRVWPGL
jgi:hypothetical protein